MKKPLILAENKEIFDKIKIRTKFEVAHAVWNPKTTSLLALGSRDGEVVVKRYLWKTGWKKNFARDDSAHQFGFQVDAFSSDLASTKAKDQLLCLCWSPDGQVLLTVFQSGFCYYLDTQTGDTLFVKKLPYAPFCVQWLKFWPKTPLKFPRIGEQSLTSTSFTNFASDENVSKDQQSVCCAVEHFYRHILPKSLTASFLCLLYSNATNTFVDIFSGGILLIRRLTIDEATLSRSLISRQNDFFVQNNRINILSKDTADSSFDIVQLPDEFGQDHLLVYDQIVDCFCWMSFCCICMQKLSNTSFDHMTQLSDEEEVSPAAALRCFSFVKPLRHSVRLLRSLFVKLTELNEGRECGIIPEKLLDTLLKIAANHPKFDGHQLLGSDENCQQTLDVQECVRYFRTLSTEGIRPFLVHPLIDQTNCIVLSAVEKEAVIQQKFGGLQTEKDREEEKERSSSDEEESVEDEKNTNDDDEHGEKTDDETRPISLHSFIFGHQQRRRTTGEERMECEENE